jgi:ATP-binding cassette subfamily C protein CydD
LVLLICPMYFSPMRASAAAFHQRERAAVAAAALSRMTEPTLAAPAAPAVAGAAALSRPWQAEPIGVTLNALRYRYPGADLDTISADVDIAAGTWTALTGASGSGKTTLLSLIAGLREPSGGRIEWQSSMGGQTPVLGECVWIGQQTVLLEGSLRDNIRLGRLEATDREVRRAASAAGLDIVLDRLPHRLDTRLGEGGWGISTGEARRVAIARALLRGPQLWLLDEPTAHLDVDSERELIEAVGRAAEGCTVVVATHVPALTAVADRVLVIDSGVLREAQTATVS